jgi:hypothetical protein
MLADPNDESPANVDAAVRKLCFFDLTFLSKYIFIYPNFLKKEWRENPAEFKRKVAKCVRKSQEAI